jgi:hypothetical protein
VHSDGAMRISMMNAVVIRAMHIVVIVMPMAIIVVINTAYLLVPIFCIVLNKDLIEDRNFSTGSIFQIAIALAWVRTELDS